MMRGMIDGARVDNRRILWVGFGPAFACLLALAACTADNPNYLASGADGGTGTGMDMSTGHPRDLSMPPSANASGSCGAGGRSCEPASCAGYLRDRNCPPGSTCQGGYCQVPMNLAGNTLGLKCGSESQCYISQQTYNNSCQPYVVRGAAEWHCGTKVGDGASGQPCMSGAECRSGYCIPGINTCFRLCAGSDADCPVRNGVHLVCRPARIVVEGIEINSTSCVLP